MPIFLVKEPARVDGNLLPIVALVAPARVPPDPIWILE